MSQEKHPIYNAACIMCIDGAWVPQSIVELAAKFGLICDLHTIPGAAKNLHKEGGDFASLLIDNLVNVSMGLHSVPKIVLLSHWNCGAYGGSDKFTSSAIQAATYKCDLLLAKEFISKEVVRRVAVLLVNKSTPEHICNALASYVGNMPKIICLSWQPAEDKNEHELIEIFD